MVSHVAGPGSAVLGGSAARAARASSAAAVEAPDRTGPDPRRHRPLHVEAVRGVEHGRVTGIRRRARAAASSPAASRAGDVVGDAVREDQALEQRVRREPVGAVHPGARALAAGVEAVDRRPAEQVGLDPAGGVVLGRRDRQQLGGRVEPELAAARRRSTGSAARGSRRPRCRASSQTWSTCWSRITSRIARATTSRGARSASSCRPAMIRAPAPSTRKAPSPRTASEMSGCWPVEPSPRKSTVGWNCTNSRSVTRAPARSAAAIPSPVATGGLVVEV